MATKKFQQNRAREHEQAKWDALSRNKKMEICSICRDPYSGFGHNAQPINDGRCCGVCNDVHVIPARLTRLFGTRT